MIVAWSALSPSTPARQTACPLRASGVDRSARAKQESCHAHQWKEAPSLPLRLARSPHRLPERKTPHRCALGGSFKLSAGGSVLVSAEVQLQTMHGNALLHARGQTAKETAASFTRARELAAEVEDLTERASACYGVWGVAYVGADLTLMREVMRCCSAISGVW
jgi:hypothetical protein